MSKSKKELQGYFVDWYLSMPDFDETLLDNVDRNGCFLDETIVPMFYMFKVGFGYGQIYSD
jgi:hypothetical protein